MDLYRPADALLGGLCAELANRLGWNVWAIRAIFLVALFLKPLIVGGIYLVLVFLMGVVLGESDSKSEPPGGLGSTELSERGQRIADLEKKFSDLERDSG